MPPLQTRFPTWGNPRGGSEELQMKRELEGVVGHATHRKKKYSEVWEERQLNNFSEKPEQPSGRTSRSKPEKKL